MAARRLNLKFRLGFLVLLLAGFTLAALGPAREALEQRRAIEIESKKLSVLRSTNKHLEEDLARLNDEQYLEKEAREQLGLVKPGEISYIVERPAAAERPRPQAAEPEPWHRRALDWLRSQIP